MGIAKRARLRQKRRWRPSLHDIVRKTFRKHLSSVTHNMSRNNALLRRLTDHRYHMADAFVYAFLAIRQHGKS